MMDMKEFLLNALATKSIAADDNQKTLNEVKQELVFEPLDQPNFALKQNGEDGVSYFEKMYAELKYDNFSLERVEHLIEIKREYQSKNYLGFEVLNNKNEASNTNDSKTYSTNSIDLSNFIASDELQDAIKTQQGLNIKTVLLSDINNNTLELDYVLKSALYALGEAPNVFEEYTVSSWADPIEQDQLSWTYDYYLQQTGAIQRNFSMERFLHLLNVKQYLRDQGHPEFQFIKKAPSQRSPSAQHQSQKTNKGQQNLLKVALAIGGAVLVAILALFNKK